MFGSGTASLKPQHLRTMTLTLITQHKPIERSTDMVFMTKKSQIQAWLNDGSTGNKILWQNVTLAKLYCGKIRIWQNDILAKSYLGKMILWQNNILAKSYLGIHTGRFPNKHTVQNKIGSRNNRNLTGRRTANPKVFDLHRRNSSKNIMKQTDPPGARIMCY